MLTENCIERNTTMSLVSEVTKQMTRPGTSATKILNVLHLLSKWADLHYGRVLLPNYNDNTLEVAYHYGLNSKRLASGQYSVPFNLGLTGYVWRSGQAALITDIKNEPQFLHRIAEPIKDSFDDMAFISVPIIVEGKPIGVLSVQRMNSGSRRFSDDLDLLRIIASILAPTMYIIQKSAQGLSFTHAHLDSDSEKLVRLCEKHGLKGSSKELLAAVKLLDSAKNSDAPVMLLGESGTGKEMFAHMLHQESNRKQGPYIAINCASIPEHLLESELFGYEKGAFTGAYKSKKGKLQLADGGTLFLDEIGDMPADLQVKLLRVLQEKKVEPIGSNKTILVDFRLITATHVNLKKSVEKGEFRLDLFYRLNVVPISLPALRHRVDDIPIIAQHFLVKYNEIYDRLLSFTTGSIETLQSYEWPGNIRQLQNIVERAVLQTSGSWITVAQINEILHEEAGLNIHEDQADQKLTFHSDSHLKETPKSASKQDSGERSYRPYMRVENQQANQILEALKTSQGNQTHAANVLGMTVRQLRYRIKKLNIDTVDYTYR
jgi:Nif-specific regulatory protein